MEPERFSYHLNLVYVFLRFFSHVLLYIIIHGKKDLFIYLFIYFKLRIQQIQQRKGMFEYLI